MDKKLRETAETILHSALRAVQPDAAVRRALENAAFPSRVCLVAVGKAAWQMAHAAYETLGERISGGIVVTKYEHARGPIGPLRIREAGHPVADENSFAAAKEVLEMTAGLCADDTVLFLVSGGGSALFELPLIEPAEQQEITRQLLACGADIVEMNTIRKRLSAVKGGRFAQHCSPAHVFSIVLSDIIGDPLDMIASGPAYPDASTEEQALEIVRKYDLRLSEQAMDCLRKPTPKALSNVETHVTGSVRELCAAAMREAEALGFRCQMLTDCLCCQAKEAGSFLASVARSHQDTGVPLAFLAGGETTVQLTGSGLGGQRQLLIAADRRFFLRLRWDGRPDRRRRRLCRSGYPCRAPERRMGRSADAARQRRLPRASGRRRSAHDRPDRHERQRSGHGPDRALKNTAEARRRKLRRACFRSLRYAQCSLRTSVPVIRS